MLMMAGSRPTFAYERHELLLKKEPVPQAGCAVDVTVGVTDGLTEELAVMDELKEDDIEALVVTDGDGDADSEGSDVGATKIDDVL